MTKKRFTLNTDSSDRYYQITDEFTGNVFDVYKLNMCETLCELLNALHEENEQLKRENELLSDELEQCKAVIENRWKEYLDKKGDGE